VPPTERRNADAAASRR